MKFSFQKEKITPDLPVMQAGFSARTHKCEGVHDDTYASVVIIHENDTVMIIALDVCYGDRSFACGIKEAITEKYGLAQDKIIISYSHTHSSVALTGEDSDKRSESAYSMSEDGFFTGKDKEEIDYTKDVDYYNIVKNKIMGMIGEGLENQIEGSAHICKGESLFGVSRRFPSEEGILWKPNFDVNSMDKDLFLIKFTDTNEQLRGLIYSYSCHPTALGPDNYLISADFPGVVRRVLEEINPGMQAVFLQGCGADVKPAASAENGRFKGCSFVELNSAGTSLAGEIQDCIEKSAWRRIETEIKTGYADMKLYTEVWSREKWQAIVDNPNETAKRKQSAVKMLASLDNKCRHSYLPYYVSYLRLDKQTCIVCLECEVVTDIGKEIKSLFSEDVIVLGYTNSSVCYIPTRKVLADGGYERDSFISARFTGPFVNEVEDMIIGRAVLMIKGT